MPVQIDTPLPLAQGAGSGSRLLFEEEKAGQPENIESVGRTGFREMTASGWQTAPPQAALEVVLVTMSASSFQLEAFPRVPDPSSGAPSAQLARALRAELHSDLTPAIVHAASASRSCPLPR